MQHQVNMYVFDFRIQGTAPLSACFPLPYDLFEPKGYDESLSPSELAMFLGAEVGGLFNKQSNISVRQQVLLASSVFIKKNPLFSNWIDKIRSHERTDRNEVAKSAVMMLFYPVLLADMSPTFPAIECVMLTHELTLEEINARAAAMFMDYKEKAVLNDRALDGLADFSTTHANKFTIH